MDAKEELINKWIKGKLSPEEQKSFEKLDEYHSYIKLSEMATSFKSPEFDVNRSMLQLNEKISQKQKNLHWYKYIAAAILLLVISLAFLKTLSSNADLYLVETLTAKNEIIKLPDNSQVDLNAKSELSYMSSNWEANRRLTLNGEALFIVQKGEKFTVHTNYGEVEVLGTVFNIKSRPYGFAVTCYEGSVQVKTKKQNIVLKANEELTLNNNRPQIRKVNAILPDWKKDKTTLKSKPLAIVLEEFKNYYDVEFKTDGVNMTQLYTGSFPHNDVEFALKSITLPLNLSYTISDKKIILSFK